MTIVPIRGKVARILNSRELAINVGSKDGVVVGMHFDVLDPKGEDIKDPDTGEILGSLERPKVRVQVVKVQDSLSVASTYKKHEVNVGGTGGLGITGFAQLFMPPKYVTKYETLKTIEKTWEDLDEKESYVKTGDPVVQVITEVDEKEIESAN
jgi:hypothetical protein